MRRALGFLGIMLAGAAASHLLFSAAVSAWIADRYTHRLFNVRNIEDMSQWGPLTRLFVEGQALDDPRPKILMFGSSVTWGYSWPERDVFSWHMHRQAEDFQVLNVAVIGQDLQGLVDLECELQELESRVVMTVIEVNLFNLRVDPSGMSASPANCDASITYHALGGYINYMHYTLSHSWGLEYFRAFWNEYDYPQAERPFTWNELPQSYFPSLANFVAARSHIDSVINSAIELAAGISDRVAVFVAPTLRDGLDLSGYDPTALQQMADIVMEACAQSHHAECLDPGLDLPSDDFGNLTHLNLRGHREFAKWLLSNLPFLEEHAGATQDMSGNMATRTVPKQ